MKSIFSLFVQTAAAIAITAVAAFLPVSAQAQTDPAAFNLSGGNFSFTNWASSSTAGTYPTNMVFWITGTTDQTVTGTPTGNYAGNYSSTSTSRFIGLAADGLGMVVTGSAGQGRPHSAVVGLNSTGRSNIQVGWTGGLVAQGDGIPTPRAYGLRLQYKIGAGGSWTDTSTVVEYLSAGKTVGTSESFGPTTLPVACENQAAVYLRWIYYLVAANNGGSRPQIRLDEVSVSSSAAGVITGAATATAFTTTYGTTSTAQSFPVSGSSLTADITATAPTGFEVSNDGIGFGATATLTQSGGTASGNIHLRLTAAAAVTGSYNAQNIPLSSTGATTVNITTAASGNSVSAAALSITGVAASNKIYSGTTSATLSGTPAYVGLVNGESFSVTGSPNANFDTAAVGPAKPVTVTGYTAPSTNYTVTQPAGLTAEVTTAALTVTATDVIKPQGNTLTGGTGYTNFTSMGLVNAETIGSVTVAYGAGAGAAEVANTYLNSVAISDATSGTFTATNYAINYEAGDLTVSASPTINTTGTLAAVDTTYGSASTPPTSFSASGAFLTADVTVTAPTNYEVSTSIGSGYGASVVLPNSGGTAAATTLYVRLAATAPVTGSPHGGNVTCASTGATTVNVATAPSSVAPKGLTIAGLTGDNKVYDRTNAAAVSGTATLGGIVGADDVSLGGAPSAIFANALVANGKPITVTGYTLGGTAVSNYSLTQPTGLTADITALALTISGAAVTPKSFDGTTAATITGTLVGVIVPDVVTLVGTGTFGNAGPGTAIPVTSMSTLAGANAGNYSLTQPVGLTGDITGGTNTDLSDMTVSSGALSPLFSLSVTSFAHVVPNGTTSFTVTPTTVDGFATVTVSGNTVASGSPSSALSLNEGLNTINVVVTAQDTVTTKTYTITVIRQSSAALSPGSIAFTGFNADGNDNLAFVALTTIPANTVIFFSEEEWSGTDWTDNSEACYAWTASATIAAGTIVTINNTDQLYSAVPAAVVASNLGTITPIRDASNNSNMGASDEAVVAFQGTGALNASGVPVPTSFLALIANEDGAGTLFSLNNTSLSEAAGTAIIFVDDEDGMAYTGSRAGQTAFADYLLLLADRATNWTTQASDGTLLLPFNLTPFSAGALSNTLTLSVAPASFSEGATNPASTGTITRSDVTASNLVVTLTSPDTTEVTVPATVTILANQATATFDVTAVNDTLPDGNKVVILNASAPASTAGTFAVTVQDDGDTLPATALQAGDIAFTTFNGDRDAIAFVALDTIPAGEVIHFTDSAWDGSTVDGSDHFVSGEGNVSWTAPVGDVAPGTVVVINAYDTTPVASVGSATGGSGISSSSETIYAYQGFAVRQPITFLAAISNATLDSIVNTGLTLGSTALQVLPSGTDQAEYTGSRVNQTAIIDYAPLIGNVATNWTGGGEGDFAGTSPNGAAFTLFTPGSTIVDIVATASAAEGNAGNTPLTLAVSRTADTTAFTVDYAVSGGTATSGTDFTALAGGTLTFAVGGALSQNITLDILGDTVIEGNETVIITLSNLLQVTGTATLGNATGTATITNDDTIPVTYPASGAITSILKSSIILGGSEIPAFDPASKRAFASSGVGIQVVNLTDPATPVQLATIVPSALGVSGLASNDVSSITVRKATGGNPSVLAAGIINNPKTTAGHVIFLNAATGALIGSTVVGVVPDHITFTPDGTKLLVCNEGELDNATIPDAAMGTVSIIAVDPAGLPGVVQTANFSAFDAPATIASLKTAGVRIFGAGVPSTDFEPEYLAISPDGTKAMVTLQEANAVAILDIATATFTSVVPLGEKDFSLGRHDFSDQDGAGGSNLVNPTMGNPVFGLYMPDAIASYQVGGQTYYVTANEGDDRNDFLVETTTVSNASYNLDDATFPTETTLKTPASLGRLVVSNFSGLRGDTDLVPDGDVDRILSYGGRSFSIHDSTGARIFDSGDMVEMIVASQFPAQFFDGRSDNKGPEPEGVTVAKIGARTFAFVGLERSHMVLAFDVTNPLAPTFATAFQRTGDTNPEGMVVVEAADSPSGKPLLIVSSEVSNTLTVFEIGQPTDFTLQLLHLADAEAGLLASSTAPNLAALVDAFDGTYPNTLILAGGDNYIPGPFAAAGTDALVAATHTRGNNPFAADIEIHNRLGVEASTVGNHEFDFGTNAFSDAILDTNFPYLSSNLDFSGDTGIFARYQETVGAGLEEATSVKNKIVPSCVVTKGTEKIGLVGVTTQILESISSTGGVEVKGFVGDGLETNNMVLLAGQVQPVIDDLISQGVDKIVLMAHLQQITFEQQLAPLLTGVDIVLAAGSNTRLGDSNDVAVAFAGHDANFAGNYPIYTAGADGLPTVIVNTDNEFTYLGRLVADFDADGVLIVPNLLANTAVNGAYAATAANAAAAWGVAVVDLPTSAAFAPGAKGTLVKQITDAVQGVITAKDGAIRGYTDVYLEGERNFVRNQETNLGDISADSMIAAGKIALPLATHVAALKNGGGIRAAIGAVDVVSGAKLPPIANPGAGKPAGAVSLLDIENSMRFNNGLMLCDTTPAGLKAILEHGVANAGTGSGRFPQIGGIRFSYVPSATAGSRIQSIVLVDEDDNITGRVVSGGLVRLDAPATITLVTLNFLAGNKSGLNTTGGDDYPFKANADNFRFLLNDGTLSANIDEALNFTSSPAVVPANILGEQLALGNYLTDRYATPATAYDIAETAPVLDTRIQSTAVRTDTVLQGPATFAAWLSENGYTSAGLVGDTDSNGTPDILEYFFNQNPNDGGDLGNLPRLSRNGADLELQFTVNSTSIYSGVLQVTGNLVNWQDAVEGTDYEVISVTSSGGETTYRYRILASGLVPKFFQLELVDAP